MISANLWESCDLKSSPFQEPLQKDLETKLLELFVGRHQERRKLLTKIGSNFSSRQAVAGRSGVGKTALVQVTKADAKNAGYWVADDLVSITLEHNSNILLGQLVAGIYDAILACNNNFKENSVMQEASQLVNAIRLQNTNIGVSVMGSGGSLGISENISNPTSGIALPARHLIGKMIKYALDCDSKGIILHLNNLENLSETDAMKAADLLRSVRDNGLMMDGLHIIIVGPTSAIQTAINRHSQIRNIFSHTINLKELALPDVHKLLENRYNALRNDPNRPFRKPIEDSAVEYLYKFFHGDLRELLNNLNDGIETLLLNLTNTESLPIDLNSLLSVLKTQNLEELEDTLDSKNLERILNWANKNPELTQTQDDLSKIWSIGQGQVSKIINNILIPTGFLKALPRDERNIPYALTNKARLATLQIKPEG